MCGEHSKNKNYIVFCEPHDFYLLNYATRAALNLIPGVCATHKKELV